MQCEPVEFCCREMDLSLSQKRYADAKKAVEGRAPSGPVLTAPEANLKPSDGHLGELRWGRELEVSPGTGQPMFRGPRGKFYITGNILGGKSRVVGC